MKIKNFTLPILLFVLGVIYYISFNYVYTSATKDLLNQQIETSKNQANLISNLLSEKLMAGYSKEDVKNELQRSIENGSTENNFVCMFDGTGKEICHPNREKIGKILTQNNSIIRSVSNQEIEKNFKEAIMEKKSMGGLRKLEKYTEIVYLSPVKNSDWIVASHSNVIKFKSVFENLKEKLSLLFILIWLGTALLIYFFLRQINTHSLEKISTLNRETGTRYFDELKAINASIAKKEVKTNRLLADKGAQLTPVFIDAIAYIFTENKISYIVEKNDEKSTINLTLDELFKTLDPNLFYRASRQVIVAAKAIDRIEKYGSTQLKVLTNPKSNIDIIISKAKLTDFKKWMGKN